MAVQPFIEQFKNWLREDLSDPTFTKRASSLTIFSRLREAHKKVLETLMTASGEQSKINYSEMQVFIRKDQEFYRWPGNFRKFRMLEYREKGNPNNVRSRVLTRSWNDPTQGIQIMSQSRGYRMWPRPTFDDPETVMWLVYQIKAPDLHYADAESYYNSGRPVLRSAEEITMADYSSPETSAVGITAGVTDHDEETGGIEVLSQTRALKLHLSADKNNLQAGDTIRVYFSDVPTAGNMVLMAGTADTTVTTNDRITMQISDDQNWVEWTLTQAFIDKIVPFTNGEFQIRVVPDPNAQTNGRVREVELKFEKEKLQSSLTIPSTIPESQGVLHIVDQYYAGAEFHIYDAATGALQTNWCTNFNAQTRIATMKYDWDPPLSGTVKYEILPCIEGEYARAIGTAAAIAIALGRRDYQGRAALLQEYHKQINDATRYYVDMTDDRAGSMVDTKPFESDPYHMTNRFLTW